MATLSHLGGLGGTSCEELLRSNNKPYFVGQTFATYKKMTHRFMVTHTHRKYLLYSDR